MEDCYESIERGSSGSDEDRKSLGAEGIPDKSSGGKSQKVRSIDHQAQESSVLDSVLMDNQESNSNAGQKEHVRVGEANSYMRMSVDIPTQFKTARNRLALSRDNLRSSSQKVLPKSSDGPTDPKNPSDEH